MRIGYITGTYPRATDTFVRIEVETLRTMGFEVHPFSVKRPDESHFVDQSIRSEAGRTVFLLGAGPVRLFGSAIRMAIGRPKCFLSTLALMWKTSLPGLRGFARSVAYLLEACLLARILAEREIQHLHNHIGENSATVAMLASQLSGVEYSMTIHGPGIFYHPRQWSLGEKIARSRFTACISDFCRSQCMIFAPPESWHRIHIIHCGLGDRFLASDPQPIMEELRFVHIGRLVPEKGTLVLLDAIRQLRDQGVEAHVTIVGDGQLRPVLEQRIELHQLQDQITLTGLLDSDRVAEEIRLSRAMVLPSFAEGLPVVIMEALALGRPVISTYVAGIPELVKRGENGWLVPAGDVNALADAMREAVEASPEQLAIMGRTGRKAVLERHDVKNEVAKLAALFEAVIRGRDTSSVDVDGCMSDQAASSPAEASAT
jgi:colanic acid/amylovoran biosynthesis glycosyltransferase